MLDIEEAAGRALNGYSSSNPGKSSFTKSFKGNLDLHCLEERFSRGRVGA
jgi:hypothetical protein